MRLIVQRVKKAKVTRVTDNKTVGEIGLGLFVLVGFKKGDTEKTVELLASKVIKLRVMSDPPSPSASEGHSKMNLSVSDSGGSFLIVSQFTLYANTKDGNRPSFVDAEDPEKARKLYNLFVEKIQESGIKTQTGSFGDYMEIDSVLDGPVTIQYDV
jgi:D-aminoacyl-tRNA deacylase